MTTALGSLLLTLSIVSEATARQQPNNSNGTTSVFLDCNAPNCDFDHFRREIGWITWVRDRTDSDIHLLVTSQQTGSGGRRYTLDYIPTDTATFSSKSLAYVSDANDTSAEVRDGIARTMAVGLVSFVEGTPLAPLLRIEMSEADEQEPQDESDPWNLWVFRLGSELGIEGESQERSLELEAFVRADRVAEDMKINMFSQIEYSREEFDEIDEGETFINSVTDYFAEVLVVWSLTDQWSAGAIAEARKSTFSNQDLGVSVGPAVEYNIFPYAESTRRSLTARYTLELAAFDYELLTVEGKMEEVLPRHSLTLAAAVQQPWGEIFGSIAGVQYLHDPAAHRIDTRLSIEYRLFRGLDLEISGSFDRIKDQFYLPAESLSPEEILVRRRQRETDFRFDLSFGFSYRFGSRFANIVNPRMDGN